MHAHRFIEALPRGYDTEVKERGATLSVGQKQLLSFARALAHDPRVLILDEATSSVDTETEPLIQDALKVLLRGRTAIVIAHRLSTVQNVDEILVMHKGRVRERGTAPGAAARSAGSTGGSTSSSTRTRRWAGRRPWRYRRARTGSRG